MAQVFFFIFHALSFGPNFFRLEFLFKTKRKLKKVSYVKLVQCIELSQLYCVFY